MGVFDYVVLSDELKERLGRYGEENYQTKYVIEGGFISVYNGFSTYRRLWSLLTWVELLVEPKPSDLLMEPLMMTVALEDIGVVRLVKVSTTLNSYVFNVEGIEDKLRGLGFSGPEVSEDEELRYVTEVLGSISLVNNKAELELVRVKDEDTFLGIRTVLRIRSGDAELSVSPNTTLRISGSEIIAERRKSVFEKVPVRTWSREHTIEDAKAVLEVRVKAWRGTKAYRLSIDGLLEVKPSHVSEELVDELVELTEDTAREVLEC